MEKEDRSSVACALLNQFPSRFQSTIQTLQEEALLLLWEQLTPLEKQELYQRSEPSAQAYLSKLEEQQREVLVAKLQSLSNNYWKWRETRSELYETSPQYLSHFDRAYQELTAQTRTQLMQCQKTLCGNGDQVNNK